MITGGESRDEKTELAESSQEKKSGEQPGEKEKENQKEKETDGKADKTVIRVLLRTNGYAGEVHPNVSLSAAGGLTLEGTKEKRETKEGESVTIAPDDTLFQGGTIRVRPKKEGEKITISSLKRALEFRLTGESWSSIRRRRNCGNQRTAVGIVSLCRGAERDASFL
ncbi:MAG: hypothetical protein ACLUUO_10225 [Sellimonas intestinalis]